MLKKLRGKFIIINMSLVITILIILLGNFYHVNIWRLERQTEMALMQAQDSARQNGKPNKVEPGRRTDDHGASGSVDRKRGVCSGGGCGPGYCQDGGI